MNLTEIIHGEFNSLLSRAYSSFDALDFCISAIAPADKGRLVKKISKKKRDVEKIREEYLKLDKIIFEEFSSDAFKELKKAYVKLENSLIEDKVLDEALDIAKSPARNLDIGRIMNRVFKNCPSLPQHNIDWTKKKIGPIRKFIFGTGYKLILRGPLTTIRLYQNNFDKFLRNGIVINEAEKGLSYIQRVCESEKRDANEFKDQLDSLENRLTQYMNQEINFEEVAKARIKYIPKKVSKKEIVNPEQQYKSPMKIRGYTAEERAKSEEPIQIKKRQKVQQIKKVTLEKSPEEISIKVMFNEHLNELYKTKAKIGQYSYTTILDVSRQKIETNPTMDKLRGRGRFKYQLENLRNKYELSPNVNIHKIKLPGFIRGFYTIEDGVATIFDIMTHSEYNRLAQKK